MAAVKARTSATGDLAASVFGRAGSSGFTLLEALVVLVILAGLTVIAVPALQRTSADARLKAAAQSLSSDLRLLRHRAVASQREMSLAIDGPHNRYLLTTDRRERRLPVDVSLSLVRPGMGEPVQSGEVRFFPDGTSTGGQMVLQHGEKTKAVTVMRPFGKVRIDG